MRTKSANLRQKILTLLDNIRTAQAVANFDEFRSLLEYSKTPEITRAAFFDATIQWLLQIYT